jgi:hypothetical protein
MTEFRRSSSGVVRVAVMTLAVVVLSAGTARAQAIFRGFVGPAQAWCGDAAGAPRNLVAGLSVGRYSGPHLDFSVGGITSLCDFVPERWLVFGGMHLYPVVLMNQRISVGVALNVDWDIPEMQQAMAGQGSGDAYLFVRPELAIRTMMVLFGDRFVRDGKTYPTGAMSLDTHIGRYRYSGNFITFGLSIHLNR